MAVAPATGAAAVGRSAAWRAGSRQSRDVWGLRRNYGDRRRGRNRDRDDGDPADHPGTEELKNVMMEELDKLPAKYRMPLVLHYFGGLSRDEIAVTASGGAPLELLKFAMHSLSANFCEVRVSDVAVKKASQLRMAKAWPMPLDAPVITITVMTQPI